MTQQDNTDDHLLHLLGDDLSGVAEAASVLARSTGQSAVIALNSSAADGNAQIICRDLDTRRVTPAEARQRTTDALGLVDGGGPVLFKIDSLLRGNVRAHLQALADHGLVAVLAPALPSAGRTVVEGVPLINGTPLAEASDVDAWRHSDTSAPTSLLELAGSLRAVVLRLDKIRSGEASLGQHLDVLMADHAVIVCDAETDDDLDRIAQAVNGRYARDDGTSGVGLVGSAGLVAAVGRLVGRGPGMGRGPGRSEHDSRGRDGAASDSGAQSPQGSPLDPASGAVPIVFVAGSTESGVRHQVAQLQEHGAVVFQPGESGDLLSLAERVRRALIKSRVVVLQAPAYTGNSPTPDAADALAALVTETFYSAEGPIDLVATGGETARRVLGALGVDSLMVIGEVHHGAVVSRTEGGALVVTRPGSFGESDSFLQIRDHLQHEQRARTPWAQREANDNV